MKKNLITKGLSLLTAAAMTFSLAACGGAGGAGSAQDSSGSAQDSSGSAQESAGGAQESAGGASSANSGTEGSVLNIWCWNDEFQGRFNDYYPEVKEVASDKSTTTLNDGTIVKWTINPNKDNNYQNKLDEALLGQENAAADDKIDIYLIEADYALKYVDSDYSMPIADLGITEADLSDQYQYTKDIASIGGVQKGTTWQATPGLFAYRRSIAKDVLGTDDPAEVQKALADWDKFNAVAEQAAAKGYKMLSGYDDSYRTFSNNVSSPWVDGSTIVVDPNIVKWIDQTKTYTDKGYNNKTTLWDDAWAADQGPKGKVFGFFYSTWGINFTLLGNSLETPEAEGGKAEAGNGIYGDYAVCQGPQPYYWGGTWICAATGTDNPATVKDIMLKLTCNKDIMKQITLDTQDYTNTMSGMKEIAGSDFKSDFLGGQNHIALFSEVAPTIDMSNAGPYDQGLNESIQTAFKDYYDGVVDMETAKKNFFTSAKEKYPDLTDIKWP
ncbi:MAG: carbohydrate ABC transporter substrate-binding protein [Lachnospiraceae bacterium]|nr:carbohydrate ABC transporter substrate-binding protein [Lachnospiraceae bacterium]